MPPQGRFSADRLPPLPFPLLPVATGRHSHDFGEQSGEIVRIVYANLEANLVDLHIGSIQQVTGLLDFQQIEIRQRSVPGHLLEQHGVVGCQARQDFLCRTLPEKAPSGRQGPQLFLQATELRKEPPVRHCPDGLFRRLAARLADLGGRPAGTQYPPLPIHDGPGTFGPEGNGEGERTDCGSGEDGPEPFGDSVCHEMDAITSRTTKEMTALPKPL